MVLRAKDYIEAGDIFQVVLAQRFTCPFTLPPLALYRALRRVNPSPFLYFLDLPGFALIGSSPEILVRVRDGEVTIRPIAGTRPRGQDARRRPRQRSQPARRSQGTRRAPDAARSRPQRRRPGGRRRARVQVTESYTIERYSHVMHIVSNVVGKLDAAKHDAIDAVFAGFPGRHRQRRAQGPRLRDHRRAGTRNARRLCRRRRLFRARRQSRQLHRAAHRRGQGRRAACPGRRGHRRRLRTRTTNSANARPRPAR